MIHLDHNKEFYFVGSYSNETCILVFRFLFLLTFCHVFSLSINLSVRVAGLCFEHIRHLPDFMSRMPLLILSTLLQFLSTPGTFLSVRHGAWCESYLLHVFPDYCSQSGYSVSYIPTEWLALTLIFALAESLFSPLFF